MKWDRTDDLLSRYWPRRRDGYSFHQKRKQEDDSDDQDEDANDQNDDDNDHTFTYGEVTALGVRQLVYEMELFSSSSASTTTSSSSTLHHRRQWWTMTAVESFLWMLDLGSVN